MSNYCRLLREKCFKGEDVYLPAFLRRWDAKKNDIYRVMRLVDAGEALAQEEGQGKPP